MPLIKALNLPHAAAFVTRGRRIELCRAARRSECNSRAAEQGVVSYNGLELFCTVKEEEYRCAADDDVCWCCMHVMKRSDDALQFGDV